MLSRFSSARCFSCIICAILTLTIAGPAFAQKKKKKLPSQKFKGYGLPEAVKSAPTTLPRVKPVDASQKQARRNAAAQIDKYVESKLSVEQLQPNPIADDYVFVRRAYLDAVGTIPTLSQTNAYSSLRSGEKAEELVDELLSSYGYVSNMYNYWASILRVKDRVNNNILSFSYRNYLKETLAKNKPYDEWVYDMLTAEGKSWENAAVNYTLRDNGMPLVHVDNTVRVFLGTQIGCAQCHDHPFDKWTQKEFYQLAAFVHGTKTRDGNGTPAFKNGNPVARIRKEMQKDDPKARPVGSMNTLLQANLFRVSFDPKRKLKLPHDYQYDDAKPNQLINPKVLWGDVPTNAKQKSKREQYATWMTSPNNPLFAKTIANRLWKKVMGVGLIEPIDDIKDDSPCQNPELLDFLTKEIIRLNFDQKEFIRTLMYTKTYRRESSNYDPSEAEFYHYPGPRLRRMTPEQVWDSVLTISVYNPFSFQLPKTSEFAAVANMDMAKATVAELQERTTKFDETVGSRGRNQTMKVANYRRNVLARASELPSPLPADHFIRQFGQCDRETIEGDSTDPTVPQILTMFNGPFTHMMLEKGSVIYDNLLRAGNSKAAIQVMFLSILNRPPTNSDRETAQREMSRGDTAMGYGNVVWALINTREFLFIQ